MAQLPSNIQNWPDFDNAANISNTINCPNPSWVDEFFDFSEARRMTHRRSVNDPVIFVEEQPGVAAHHNDLDGIDDEQFINMFTEDNVCPSFDPSNPSNPSTSSSGAADKESMPNEHNKVKQTQQEQQEQIIKKESEEAESQFHTKYAGAPENQSAKTLQPKRVKRILANRQSAQRSRVRKMQYISELERSVTTLQAEVFMLSPRVTFLDQQRLLLNVDNSALKQRIAALAQDRIFKDAVHEALTREIERLRELYHHQNLTHMENHAHSPRLCEAEQLLNI